MAANILLECITGSVSYGLNTADSDVDKSGIFLSPTRDIISLKSHKETIEIRQPNPDAVYHELAKYCKLALAGNPNIMEVLWAEDYTITTDIGEELINLRESFLSNRIRKTYAGYARAQVMRLKRREDGTFSSNTKNRTAKHARHVIRLMFHGSDLLRTGKLTLKLSPERVMLCHMAGEQAANDVDGFIYEYEKMAIALETLTSVLPDEPDFDAINNFLIDVRKNNW